MIPMSGNHFFSSLTPEHLQRLALAMFAGIGQAMMITDRDNRIVAVNEVFTTLTGYSEEDAIGQNPSMLKSGSTPPETYTAMWHALAAHDSWAGELWDKAKDGTLYPKWITIAAIRDADGEIENYLACFSDLVQNKEAADRLAYLAQHDPLTKLFNRTSMDAQLQQALTRAKRERVQVAVMLIDLDRFKIINDTLEDKHQG